jgi:hypothetical protein
MKKLTLSLCAIAALSSAAFAGTEMRSSGKEVQQQAVAQTSCFNDREWNVDVYGLYGFTGNSWTQDRYLQADHIWGGGVDVNYFFMRYLGAGIDGWAAGAHGDVFGEVAGNLIMRYPIPNSCFAPYAYLGGGVIFNGSNVEQGVRNGRNVGTVADRSNSEGLGKGGVGIEYRFTPRIGIMNDFSWNVVNGPNNNFGMVRAGLRFAF